MKYTNCRGNLGEKYFRKHKIKNEIQLPKDPALFFRFQNFDFKIMKMSRKRTYVWESMVYKFTFKNQKNQRPTQNKHALNVQKVG